MARVAKINSSGIFDWNVSQDQFFGQIEEFVKYSSKNKAILQLCWHLNRCATQIDQIMFDFHLILLEDDAMIFCHPLEHDLDHLEIRTQYGE
ncbi:MAG: hypothetical protein IPP01_09635 [Saprospiraceae bacterium]|nr:hypothetical protein [Saprospiraceae bacterium]